MAGDCPHKAHLEATLQQHSHDSSQFIAATHESYLKIIDELKNDLNEISLEVVKVQEECHCPDEKLLAGGGEDLVTSLKELEIQNDRLQQALKEETDTKEAALTQLNINNETLKCQIHQLTKLLLERNNYIQFLKTQLSQQACRQPQIKACITKSDDYGPAYSDCCANKHRIADMEKRIETLSTELDKSQRQEHFLQAEIRKLNEEVNEHKRRNGDLVGKAHRLAGLLKNQETHHLELASKYEELEREFDDQAKKLRTANTQVTVLNDRFQMLDRLLSENKLERNLLSEEVFALKEKEAIVVGRQKSMQEQMANIENELRHAHEVIKEQQCVIQRNETFHADLLKRLKDENLEVKKKMGKLFEEHKRLCEEREMDKKLVKQYEKTLETYRQWKESQVKEDEKIRLEFEKHSDIFRLLQEEKDICIAEFHRLHQDYLVMQEELERAKSLKFREYNVIQPTVGHTLSERMISERTDLLRQTLLRLSEQYTRIENEPGFSQTQQRSQSDTRSTESSSENSSTKKLKEKRG